MAVEEIEDEVEEVVRVTVVAESVEKMDTLLENVPSSGGIVGEDTSPQTAKHRLLKTVYTRRLSQLLYI